MTRETTITVGLFLIASLAAVAAEGDWLKVEAGGPSPRTIMSAAFDSDRGVTVLHGGVIGPNKESAETWEFDGTTWEKKSEGGPGPRYAAAMVYDSARHQMLLIGGAWHEKNEYKNAGNTWAWDGQVWERLADDGPPAVHGGGAAFDPVRKTVVFFGGFRNRTLPDVAGHDRINDFSAQTWEWDGISWRLAAETGPAERYSSALGWDPLSGRVILYGGRDHAGNEFTDTWAWDGTSWKRLDVEGPRTTAGHMMAWSPAVHALMLSGGYDFGSRSPRDYIRKTWKWDGQAWRHMPDMDMPATLSWPVVTTDPSGGLLVFGRGQESMHTWRWLPESSTNWQQIPGQSPPLRIVHGMAMHGEQGQAILFGGTGGGGRDDTWLFDGTAWLKQQSAGPRLRWDILMAYLPENRTTVLFGGKTNHGTPDTQNAWDLGDTWSWNGSSWRMITAEGPAPRHLYALTYSPSDRGLLLHGGNTTDGRQFGDTWVWNGTSWQQESTSGPGPRLAHGMAADPLSGHVYLFGGYDRENERYLQDLWRWDGSIWTEIKMSGDWPAARSAFEMISLADGGVLVSGGWSDGYVTVKDSWVLNGTTWTRLVPSPMDGLLGHRLVQLPDGRLLLFGGRDEKNMHQGTWIGPVPDGQ